MNKIERRLKRIEERQDSQGTRMLEMMVVIIITFLMLIVLILTSPWDKEETKPVCKNKTFYELPQNSLVSLRNMENTSVICNRRGEVCIYLVTREVCE